MSRNVVPCAQHAGQRNDFELIPTVQMESQQAFHHDMSWCHVINLSWQVDTGVSTCHDFPRFVFISEKSRPEVGSRWRWSRIFWGFWKKDPLRANFHKRFPKGFMRTRKHVLCANIVKFGRPEVGKVVRYLLDKKKQNFGTHSSSRFCAYRVQNLPGPAPDNRLGISQISSKSVHFRRSYSRTRKHRWNGPQSVSNTRRSFFAE